MQILLNAQNTESDFIQGTETCFDGWGGLEMFHWIFSRPIGPFPTDRWLFLEDGRVVGGTALNYRRLKSWHGQALKVAIIGSSFTMPEYQRRGLFSEMVRKTVERAKERGVHLYLAFVRRSNTSYRCLMKFGCHDVPSWHCSLVALLMGQARVSNLRIEEVTAPDLAVLRCREESSRGNAVFSYSLDEWAGQFLSRPLPSHLFLVKDGVRSLGYFVVAEAATAAHLLEVVPEKLEFREDMWRAAVTHAISLKSRVLAFTTDEDLLQIMQEMGFRSEEGSVTVIPLVVEREGQIDWSKPHFQAGDRV